VSVSDAMTGVAADAGEAPRRTQSPEATEALGRALAPALRTGDLIALHGPLGSGKTRFVAGLALGLDARARVRSPSFTLLHEYRGRLPLFHADLYRLEPRDVPGLGLEEALEQGPLAVEWGERLPPAMLADALAIRFELVSENERALHASGRGPRGLELLEAWRRLPR
jgi:tRNA threonylcarbamoyladenosine biosynthesis protein TsaE